MIVGRKIEESHDGGEDIHRHSIVLKSVLIAEAEKPAVDVVISASYYK